MKIRVTMKDPDTLHDSIHDAVHHQIAERDDLDDDEREALQESREEKTRELCSKWFEYGEYLTVEIDTDANTCVVVEKRR